jgi:ribosome assembly protein RRB1
MLRFRAMVLIVRMQVFQPGVHQLEEGQQLDYDRTAYDCLHKWALDWPSLSFDIVKDSLGGPRSSFPLTAFMVAGTQAAPGEQNYISVMKLSALTQGDHGKVCCDEILCERVALLQISVPSMSNA